MAPDEGANVPDIRQGREDGGTHKYMAFDLLELLRAQRGLLSQQLFRHADHADVVHKPRAPDAFHFFVRAAKLRRNRRGQLRDAEPVTGKP